MKTLVIGFRAHSNAEWAHFNLITLQRPYFPKRSHSQVPGRYKFEAGRLFFNQDTPPFYLEQWYLIGAILLPRDMWQHVETFPEPTAGISLEVRGLGLCWTSECEAFMPIYFASKQRSINEYYGKQYYTMGIIYGNYIWETMIYNHCLLLKLLEKLTF